jgi:hypothetical protein
VRRIAVGAAYRRVGAGRALLANWESAWVLFGLVRVCADSTAGVVSAKRSRMTISPAVSALGAPSVCNIVIQLTFSVADDEVLSANVGLFHIARKRHDNCRVCLVLPTLSWSEPPWSLPLDQLRIISGDALGDFGQ